MGTNLAPVVANLFLFCYDRDFMMSLSDDKQADIIDAFNTTSRYLDDILNINNVHFDDMVGQIYTSELQLNKVHFELVNFQLLEGDVPRSTSYGVYVSQLIRFARAFSHIADFNTSNKLLTQKLFNQCYLYHKLRKIFSEFDRRYYDLISKFQVGFKSL